jgi:hypothetical protein
MSQTTGSTDYGSTVDGTTHDGTVPSTGGHDSTLPATGRASRRVSTETKSAVKTTEMVAFVVVTVAMLIASQMVDGFDAQHAWFYASLLTIGYMVSRGLAKSGSRNFYDDDYSRNAR